MGNRGWLKIKRCQTVGDSESKGLKVAALNLFHPTASLLFHIAVISYYDTISEKEGCAWGGQSGSSALGCDLLTVRAIELLNKCYLFLGMLLGADR